MHYDPYSKTNQYLLDAAIVGVSFFAAYWIRFEGSIPSFFGHQFWTLVFPVVAGRLLMHSLFGVYRQMWRYISLKDTVQIGLSFGAFTFILILLRSAAGPGWAVPRVPYGVIAIEMLLSFHLSVSARVLRRVLYSRQAYGGVDGSARRRMVLLGAGTAGVMTVKSLQMRPDVDVVGFLDDDPKKLGAIVSGSPVLGTLADLPRIAAERGVTEAVVCLARGPRDVIRRVWRICDQLQIRTLIIPEVDEILDGMVQFNRLRDMKVEDLLGRETLDLATLAPELGPLYSGKRILVTGAGGSIGSELVRQIFRMNPASVLLLDKDENCLHDLHCMLQAQETGIPHELVVADVRNTERVCRIISRFRPQSVFHAAAHKHVPLMEKNPSEAVLNNVFGTRNVLEQSLQSGAELFVLISTDKAVNPTSIMGASKRLAELLVQMYSRQDSSKLACVRFGNVMSSRGSVLPLFQEQIRRGGPITLTDPRITRYFMTIPEAVHLVSYVGLLEAPSGSIFVLDMGDPVLIADLARDLIEFSGLRPGQDIKIETVGLRPGEKLAEELVGRGESAVQTSHPKIFRIESDMQGTVNGLPDLLVQLQEAATGESISDIYRLMENGGIGFHAS